MVITSGNEITPISYKCNVLPVPFWHFTCFCASRFQCLLRLHTIFSPMDPSNHANGFPAFVSLVEATYRPAKVASQHISKKPAL